MTAPITSLPAAVAALGALPMPAGPANSTTVDAPQAAVNAWNRAHPVGTPVIAYPFVRPEHPVAVRYREAVESGRAARSEKDPCTRLGTSTRSKATVLGGHTAVVWVHGHSACIALSHIDVRTKATDGEAAEQAHQLDPALDYTRRQETK